MITILKKLTLIPLVMFILVLISSFPSFAETITDTPTSTPTIAPTPTQGPTPTPDNSKEINSLQGQINELQKKVSDLQGQERTLSSQIAVMDSQMKLTQLRINATRDQIAEINEDIDTTSKRIDGLQDSLDQLTKVLLNRIRVTYEVGSVQPFHVLLYSSSASDFVERVNYLRIAQQHDKQLIYDTQQAKNDYANQKEIFEQKKDKIAKLKAQLVSYTKQLDNEKSAKISLLAVTKNDEKKYQDLLSKARAEFAAIQGIISGGGSETEAGLVTEGQRIASIIPSASCNSSGGHVHFMVSKNGATENPFSYLKGIESNNCSGSSCGSSDGDSFNPSGNWSWPISGPIEMFQGYGSTWATRNTWVSQIYNFHNGLDIKGSSLEVKAVQSGTLYRGSYAGYNCRLPYVRLRHNSGIDTFYLHVYF